jgi:hypothetical protein
LQITATWLEFPRLLQIFSYNKLTTTPTVSITSPAAGTLINGSNVTAFNLGGNCSAAGQPVILKVGSTQLTSVGCATNNTWTAQADFTGIPDGAVIVSAYHSDIAGNPANSQSRNFTKQSVGPGAFSITGPVSSTNPTPTVTWGASSSTSFYDVIIGTGTNCANPILTTTSLPNSQTSLLVSPALFIGTYYVCVQARDNYGNATAATNSGTYSFSVQAGLTCSGGGTLDTTCYVNNAQTVSQTGLIGRGSLVIQSGGSLVGPSGTAPAPITMTGDITFNSGGSSSGNFNFSCKNFTINSGATVSANATGYPGGMAAGNGPGAGQGTYNSGPLTAGQYVWGQFGAAGSYGGSCGLPSGSTYGSLQQPVCG